MLVNFGYLILLCAGRRKMYQKLIRKLTGLLLLTWIGGMLRYAFFKLGIEFIFIMYVFKWHIVKASKFEFVSFL